MLEDGKLMECHKHDNLNMVKDLYVDLNDKRYMSWVRGKGSTTWQGVFVQIFGGRHCKSEDSAKVCEEPNLHCHYSHTLWHGFQCEVDEDKGSHPQWASKGVFQQIFQGVEEFCANKVMSVEHNTRCTQARVCVIYFLMIRRPVNVCEIILGRCLTLGLSARWRGIFMSIF